MVALESHSQRKSRDSSVGLSFSSSWRAARGSPLRIPEPEQITKTWLSSILLIILPLDVAVGNFQKISPIVETDRDV